jgi:hypothetical protein
LRPAGVPPVLSVRMDFLIDPDAAPGLFLLEVECVAPVKFFPLFPDRAADYARLILALSGGSEGGRDAPRPARP